MSRGSHTQYKKKAVEKLSLKQQEAVNKILEGGDASMANAARYAGLSESAYRKMFSTAKKHLREILDVEEIT